MKRFLNLLYTLILLVGANTLLAQTVELKNSVLNNGDTTGVSTSFNQKSSVGESAVGISSSTSFLLNAGFNAVLTGSAVVPESGTDILTYNFTEETGAATIDAVNHTVDIEVDYGTNLTSLVASFTLSAGASAAISSVPQFSGVTDSDFTNAVTYTITAEDAGTQDWTVVVSVAPNTATDFLSFSFSEETGSATIDAVNHTIAIEVVKSAVLTDLVASFTLSEGATASVSSVEQVSGVTSNDYSFPVMYSVTAQDGSTKQDWAVTVSRSTLSSTETDFLSFSFDEETTSADINATSHTIDIEVVYGTELADLIAAFTLSAGATATVSSVSQQSTVTSNDFTASVVYAVLAEDGTTSEDWTVNVTIAPNTATDILAFSMDDEASSAMIDTDNHTVDIEVLYGADLTSLVATFTLSHGAILKKGVATQVSGVTVNSYVNSVTFTVIAEDGTTTQDWVVTVTIGPNTATDFLTFIVPGQSGDADINTANHTIALSFPYGTDVSNLISTFTLSDGATVTINSSTQVSGVTTNNYTSGIVCLITAQDGTTTQNWSVTVSIDPNTETDFLTFSIPGQSGTSVINAANYTILATMPYGTNATSLVSTFTLSDGATSAIGSTGQQSGVTANDFSSDVVYSITAEDGTTTQDWTVTVSIEPNDATDILTYSIAGQANDAVINDVSYTVAIEIPATLDITNLVASFTLSDGATSKINSTLQESGVTANNFTNDVVYTITAEDGLTNQDWTVTVTVEAADDNNPQLTLLEQPTSYVYNSAAVSATVRVIDESDLDVVSFYYRRLEKTEWSSKTTSVDGDEYSAEIEPQTIGMLGIEYYFKATDIYGNKDSTAIVKLYLEYSESDSPAPTLQAGTTVDKYQIVSVPLVLTNKAVSSVFDELMPYDTKHWRLFHYTDGTTKEYNSGFTTIESGRGYWLIMRSLTTVNVGAGKTVALDADKNFNLELKPGWNQVGNPFNFDISWEQVRTDNNNPDIGSLKLFNAGSLTEGTVLPRFRGGFVMLDGSSNVTVKISPVTTSGGRKSEYMNDIPENNIDNPDWFLPISVTNGVIKNNLMGIGMTPDASISKDTWDEILMPVPKAICSFKMFFDHPEHNYPEFSQDIVNSSDSYEWNFTVEDVQPGQALTLKWRKKQIINSSRILVLEDMENHKVINMQEFEAYTFTSSGENNFKIAYGEEQEVMGRLNPEIALLGDGYPNPFIDQITLPFTIPDNGSLTRVRITIMDLKGQVVDELVNDSMKGGYYHVDWYPDKDQLGMPQGLYVVRMVVDSESGNQVITKKILLQ